MSNESIISKLDQLVMLKTQGFCYGCYIKADLTDQGEKCPKCGSDDLMRILDGYGCEYGTESFYEQILEEIGANKCKAQFDENWYEEQLNEIYGTVKICGVEFDAGHAYHELDPLTFDLGLSEEISNMEEDGEIIEIKDQYYWVDQLEEILDAAIYDSEIMKS